MQTTSQLLMIRPVRFGYNPETAVNNAFQVKGTEANVQEKALQEFDAFVSLLRAAGVDVMVVDDTPDPHTPDSIFPNNWISFHEDGTVVLYPMFAVNRRLERKQNVIDQVRGPFTISRTIDLTHYENENRFLEGTGSMVLDRENKIAYACLSARTDEAILKEWCQQVGYRPVAFKAVDAAGQPIYHTNVMMCVADRYVVACLHAIPDHNELEKFRQAVTATNKAIVPISPDQMNRFAGNMLQVVNKKGEKLLVMSTQAYQSLEPWQLMLLNGFNRILHSPLTTIETNGGGSARCMMAEVHLPPR